MSFQNISPRKPQAPRCSNHNSRSAAPVFVPASTRHQEAYVFPGNNPLKAALRRLKDCLYHPYVV